MPNSSRKRVAPVESSSEIIEIRPSRFLRVQHHNARPRDKQFNKEMELFMQYKKTGIPSSGPLTMPKRFASHTHSQSLKTPPTSAQGNRPSCALDANYDKRLSNDKSISADELVINDLASQSIPDDDIVTSYVNPSLASSILSTPCHGSASADKIQSASSVLVALHMSQQQNLFEEQKFITDSSGAGMKSDSHLFKKSGIHHSPSHESYPQKTIVSDENKSPIRKNSDDKQDTNCGSDCKEFNQSKATYNYSNGVVNGYNGNMSSNSDVVLFFIHGVGGCSDIWCAQIQYFTQQGYEVIAPDLIGHGFSRCPRAEKAYHFREIAADMVELFDKYCKKRNVVIGHSYGASFATMLARTRPRRVIKLVLVSSGPPTPLAPQPGVFTLPTCLLGCIKPCLVCGFKKGAFHKKRKPVISKKNAFSVPTSVLQNMMKGQDWPDGDELYHRWLTCPCLLIYGMEDQLVSLEEELETQRAIFNSHLEVVKDASHMVMMEAPNEVNELLANFFDETLSTRTHDFQGSPMPDSVRPSSSFRRQKSVISLKSHVPHKTQSQT